MKSTGRSMQLQMRNSRWDLNLSNSQRGSLGNARAALLGAGGEGMVGGGWGEWGGGSGGGWRDGFLMTTDKQERPRALLRSNKV